MNDRNLAYQVSLHDVTFSMVRAQGPGGQNVNKVACAVHLRFDIQASSLPELGKAALLATPDQRISKEGVIIIKAQAFRRFEKNKADALARLQDLVDRATRTDPPRKPTKPSYAAKQRRLDGKALRGEIKQIRHKIAY